VDDEAMMRRAIALAERGLGLASPNPVVGSLVADGEGRVIGEGWHEGPGSPHAEVVALRAAGPRAAGSTLFTTLEPCDHHGRTPPCTLAIIDSGISRVVAATGDPNPVVDGRGFARLRDAGVEVVTPVLREAAERQNRGFLKHVRTGRPFVLLKMAATLDGKVAAKDGSSRWITGTAARSEVHRLRGTADAIVVGAGTALGDDPVLTVRDAGYRGEPVLRVLVDGRGRVPASARLFSQEAPTLVATTDRAPVSCMDAWRGTGAEVTVYEEDDEGRVPLRALLSDLGKRDVQSALLEGGPTLAWSAVRAGVVDGLVLFLAPRLLGGASAPGILGGEGLAPVGAAVRVQITSVERVGEDLKVEADVHRDS
jgi:diaminohydroxyphosphoribosylaminopyrimidine deaminase/5-amino-6-(5-phosphoribosylamino)uracil reductase